MQIGTKGEKESLILNKIDFKTKNGIKEGYMSFNRARRYNN